MQNDDELAKAVEQYVGRQWGALMRGVTNAMVRDRYGAQSEELKRMVALGMVQEYIDAAVRQVRESYLAKGVFMHDLSELSDHCADREKYIIDACASTPVLHFGFADAPFKAGFHQRIKAVAALTFGVDINKDAVKSYTDETGDRDVAVGDVQDGVVVEHDPRFGVILLPEVLEHVRCVEKALLTIKANCAWHGCHAIITVPNAFFFGNLFSAVEGKEIVHPDHRYWFSPYTFKKCLEDAGLVVKDFLFYSPVDMVSTPGLTKSGLIARVGAE